MSHKPIVWKESDAYCGNEPIGLVRRTARGKHFGFLCSSLNRSGYKYAPSLKDAKKEVEEEFEKFYDEITEKQ